MWVSGEWLRCGSETSGFRQTEGVLVPTEEVGTLGGHGGHR